MIPLYADRFDNAPNIAAAAAFVKAENGGGGYLRFPAPLSKVGTTQSYITNSYLTLTSVPIVQEGAIVAGDTISFSGNWRGVQTAGAETVCPQFCIESHISMSFVGANPGIYLGNGTIPEVSFSSNSNGYNLDKKCTKQEYIRMSTK